MKRHWLEIAAVLLLELAAESIATAATVDLISPPVHHPVLAPTAIRESSHWRINLGKWGQEVAGQTLHLRGYDRVYSGGYHGIDLIGVKRAADGSLKDVLIVEVKTNSAPKPQLGKTKSGQQMSREWLADKLKRMRRSRNPEMKKLALEISHFKKASGRSVQSLGEVMHINPQTGQARFYLADGKTEKASDSVEHLLKRIQAKASSRSARRWAARQLAAWDQIKAAGMADWIGQEGAFSPSRRAAKRVLARVAGPIALIAAVAFDVKEISAVEAAYRHGLISVRQRNTSHTKAIGGIAGAFAGAEIGFVAGTWIGAFGGPFAVITVPVAEFVGVAIGGVGGYFAGSAVAGYAATRWYQSIDSRVRDRFELEWASLPVPASASTVWRE